MSAPCGSSPCSPLLPRKIRATKPPAPPQQVVPCNFQQRRWFAGRLRWETDTKHAKKLERFGKDPLAVFSYCHAYRTKLQYRDWLAALTLLTTQQHRFDSSWEAFRLFNEHVRNFGVTNKNLPLILHRYAVLRYTPAVFKLLPRLQGLVLDLPPKQLALAAWSLGRCHVYDERVWDLLATKMVLIYTREDFDGFSSSGVAAGGAGKENQSCMSATTMLTARSCDTPSAAAEMTTSSSAVNRDQHSSCSTVQLLPTGEAEAERCAFSTSAASNCNTSSTDSPGFRDSQDGVVDDKCSDEKDESATAGTASSSPGEVHSQPSVEATSATTLSSSTDSPTTPAAHPIRHQMCSFADLALMMWGFAAVERKDVRDIGVVQDAVRAYLHFYRLVPDEVDHAVLERKQHPHGHKNHGRNSLTAMISPRFSPNSRNFAFSIATAPGKERPEENRDPAQEARRTSGGKDGQDRRTDATSRSTSTSTREAVETGLDDHDVRSDTTTATTGATSVLTTPSKTGPDHVLKPTPAPTNVPQGAPRISSHSLVLLLKSFCTVSPSDTAFLTLLLSATTRALEDCEIQFTAQALTSLYQVTTQLLQNRVFFPNKVQLVREVEAAEQKPSDKTRPARPRLDGARDAQVEKTNTENGTSSSSRSLFQHDRHSTDSNPPDWTNHHSAGLAERPRGPTSLSKPEKQAVSRLLQTVQNRAHLLRLFLDAVNERSRRLRLDIAFNQDHVVKILQAMELLGRFAEQNHFVEIRRTSNATTPSEQKSCLSTRREIPGAENSGYNFGKKYNIHNYNTDGATIRTKESKNLLATEDLRSPLLSPPTLARDPRLIYQVLAFVGSDKASHLRADSLLAITTSFANMQIRDEPAWKRLAVRFQKIGAEFTSRELRKVQHNFEAAGRSNSRIEGVAAAYLEVRQDREMYGPC
ncbi:unnamed protein product [Amoebophrya sp. A120]|nr:unnamed protein product [Amoebophrya sp. A120]|eukprot:GSA120T00001064001.1